MCWILLLLSVLLLNGPVDSGWRRKDVNQIITTTIKFFENHPDLLKIYDNIHNDMYLQQSDMAKDRPIQNNIESPTKKLTRTDSKSKSAAKKITQRTGAKNFSIDQSTILNLIKKIYEIGEKSNKWKAEDIEKYIRTTIDENKFKGKCSTLDYIVSNGGLVSGLSSDEVLECQKFMKTAYGKFTLTYLKQILTFAVSAKRDWGWQFKDVISLLENAKPVDQLGNIIRILTTDSTKSMTVNQAIDCLKCAEKLKGAINFKLPTVIRLQNASNEAYERVLQNYYDKEVTDYSQEHLLSFISYYIKQDPPISDDTLKSLVDGGLGNVPAVLERVYKWATNYDVKPATLEKFFKAQVSTKFNPDMKYLLILMNYGLKNNIPENDIDLIMNGQVEGIDYIFKNCKRRNWTVDNICKHIYSLIGQKYAGLDVVSYLSVTGFDETLAERIMSMDRLEFWLGLRSVNVDFFQVFQLKDNGILALNLFRAYIHLVRSGLCKRELTMTELTKIAKYGDKKANSNNIANEEKRALSEDKFKIILRNLCVNKGLKDEEAETILTCSERIYPDVNVLEKILKYATSEVWKNRLARKDTGSAECDYFSKVVSILNYVLSKRTITPEKKEEISKNIIEGDDKDIKDIFETCKSVDWPDNRTAKHIVESLLLNTPLSAVNRFLKMNSELDAQMVHDVLELKPDIDYWEGLHNRGFSGFNAAVQLKTKKSLWTALDAYTSSDCKVLTDKKLIAIMYCDRKPEQKYDFHKFKSIFNSTCSKWTAVEVREICRISVKAKMSADEVVERFSQDSRRKIGPTHWDENFVGEFIDYNMILHKPNEEWENSVYDLDNQTMRQLVFETSHNNKKDVFNYIYNSMDRGLTAKPMVDYLRLSKYNDVRNCETVQTQSTFDKWLILKRMNCDVEAIAQISEENQKKTTKENAGKIWMLIDVIKEHGEPYSACNKSSLLRKILEYDLARNGAHDRNDLKAYIQNSENTNVELLADLFQIAIDHNIPHEDFVQFFLKKGTRYLNELQSSEEFMKFHKKRRKTPIIYNALKGALTDSIEPNVLYNFFELGEPLFLEIVEQDNNILNRFFMSVRGLPNSVIIDILRIAKDFNVRPEDVVNFFEDGGTDLLKIMNINEKFTAYLKNPEDNKFEVIKELAKIIKEDTKIPHVVFYKFFDFDGHKFLGFLVGAKSKEAKVLLKFAEGTEEQEKQEKATDNKTETPVKAVEDKKADVWDLKNFIKFINEKLGLDDEDLKNLFAASESDLFNLIHSGRKWTRKTFEEYVENSVENNVSVPDMRDYADLSKSHTEALLLQRFGSLKLWQNMLKKSDLKLQEVIKMREHNNKRNIEEILSLYDESCNEIKKEIVLAIVKYDEANDYSCTNKDLQEFLKAMCRPDNFNVDEDTKTYLSRKQSSPKSCAEIKGLLSFRALLGENRSVNEYAKRWLEVFNSNYWNAENVVDIFRAASESKTDPKVVNLLLTEFNKDIMKEIKSGHNRTFHALISDIEGNNFANVANLIKLIKAAKKFDDDTLKEFLSYKREHKWSDDHAILVMTHYDKYSKLSPKEFMDMLRLEEDWTPSTLMKCIHESGEEWWTEMKKLNVFHPCRVVGIVESEKSLVPYDVARNYTKHKKCDPVDFEVLKQLSTYHIKTDENKPFKDVLQFACNGEKWDRNSIVTVIKRALEVDDVAEPTALFVLQHYTKAEAQKYPTLEETVSLFLDNEVIGTPATMSEMILLYLDCNYNKDSIRNLYPRNLRFLSGPDLVTGLKKSKDDNCNWETMQSYLREKNELNEKVAREKRTVEELEKEKRKKEDEYKGSNPNGGGLESDNQHDKSGKNHEKEGNQEGKLESETAHNRPESGKRTSPSGQEASQ